MPRLWSRTGGLADRARRCVGVAEGAQSAGSVGHLAQLPLEHPYGVVVSTHLHQQGPHERTLPGYCSEARSSSGSGSLGALLCARPAQRRRFRGAAFDGDRREQFVQRLFSEPISPTARRTCDAISRERRASCRDSLSGLTRAEPIPEAVRCLRVLARWASRDACRESSPCLQQIRASTCSMVCPAGACLMLAGPGSAAQRTAGAQAERLDGAFVLDDHRHTRRLLLAVAFMNTGARPPWR